MFNSRIHNGWNKFVRSSKSPRGPRFWILSVAALAVISAGFGVLAVFLNGQRADGSSDDSIVHMDGFAGAPSSSESARRAALIIRGTVTDVKAPEWNTPDGSAPQLSGRDLVQSGYNPFTPYVVKVSKVLKGAMPPSGEVTLRMIGGSADGVTFVADGQLQIAEGNDVVAFVRECHGARAERETLRYFEVAVWVVNGDQAVDPAGYSHPLTELLANIDKSKDETPLYTPPAC